MNFKLNFDCLSPEQSSPYEQNSLLFRAGRLRNTLDVQIEINRHKKAGRLIKCKKGIVLTINISQV